MSAGKIFVLVGWAVGIVSLFLEPGSTAVRVGRLLFWFLVIAHAVECALFLPLLRKAPGGLGSNLVQTALFGMFHVLPLRSRSH